MLNANVAATNVRNSLIYHPPKVRAVGEERDGTQKLIRLVPTMPKLSQIFLNDYSKVAEDLKRVVISDLKAGSTRKHLRMTLKIQFERAFFN